MARKARFSVSSRVPRNARTSHVIRYTRYTRYALHRRAYHMYRLYRIGEGQVDSKRRPSRGLAEARSTARRRQVDGKSTAHRRDLTRSNALSRPFSAWTPSKKGRGRAVRPGMRGQGSEIGASWTRFAKNPRGGSPLWVKCSRRDLNPCQKLERLLSLATRLREREVALTAGRP